MFNKNVRNEYKPIMEGVGFKTLVYGSNTLMSEFRIKKGAVIPPHRHPHEQIGYLLSGKLIFKVGDECFTAEVGDSWCFLGDVEHAAEAVEDTLVVEVFSPVREDLLL